LHFFNLSFWKKAAGRLDRASFCPPAYIQLQVIEIIQLYSGIAMDTGLYLDVIVIPE